MHGRKDDYAIMCKMIYSFNKNKNFIINFLQFKIHNSVSKNLSNIIILIIFSIKK